MLAIGMLPSLCVKSIRFRPPRCKRSCRQAIDELIDEPMWKRTSRREKREIGKLNRMMQNDNGR